MALPQVAQETTLGSIPVKNWHFILILPLDVSIHTQLPSSIPCSAAVLGWICCQGNILFLMSRIHKYIEVEPSYQVKAVKFLFKDGLYQHYLNPYLRAWHYVNPTKHWKCVKSTLLHTSNHYTERILLLWLYLALAASLSGSQNTRGK